ncbi:MAG: metallophosphoesterase [Melioribacteraceae bacterium]|nr:metallophosphoesterase [Melioribacteraceae bacterium]
MRLAHLSDIHLNTFFKKSNIIKTKKLLKLALEKDCDHLVITGDISDNSEKKDYIIFKKILKSFDLLDSSKTSIIIGNHDIFGGVQTALDVVNFPAKCLTTNYEKKVDEFVRHFEELFENCYFPINSKIFPYSKMIDKIQLIGLNTIDYYSRIRNPFASNGKIYKDQLKGIKQIFSNKEFNPKHRVVLAHHHFYKNNEEATSSNAVWNKIESYTLKLRGKKNLLKLFRRKRC